MRISLWLNDKDETEIAILYDMQSNPYKVGDVISLSFQEPFPIEYQQRGSDEERQSLRNHSDRMAKKFKHKKVKIVSEYKMLELSATEGSRIVIEYFCDYVDEKEKL